MRLTMNEKRTVAKAMTARYRKASKKEKGRFLDEFVALTGYHRRYAVGLLRGHGQAMHRGRPRKPQGSLAPKARRRRTYDEPVAEELKNIWAIMDSICGKRLAAILPEVIRVLEHHHEIALSPAVREKLCAISAASIDRLLAPERRGLRRRRAVGYARYETPEQWRLLNELYSHLRLYTNFFQPVMKLLSKERSGATVKKTYDRPQTPYQRLLSGPWLGTAAQERLKAQYAELNPAHLKRAITALQTRLLKTAARKLPSEASTMTSKPESRSDHDAHLTQIIT